jgi:hypothetical protein
MSADDFEAQNTEARPYPIAAGCSLFGTVSDCTDRQGLDAHFIVELFTVRLCSTDRRACIVGSVSRVATRKLPTPASVERT